LVPRLDRLRLTRPREGRVFVAGMLLKLDETLTRN